METPESANEIALAFEATFQRKTGPTLLDRQLQKTGQELITMKIYKNNYYDEDGYLRRVAYFAKKRDAERAAKAAEKHLEYRTVIDSLVVRVTRKGLMAALNMEAREFSDN